MRLLIEASRQNDHGSLARCWHYLIFTLMALTGPASVARDVGVVTDAPAAKELG